ncbi:MULTISPECIES: quinone oxidoreductase family protein [Psychrobacter]|uniref:quinone oxidoreductase family protein n=1 Tax=Psychrobacter TaxID=497 RepID=UPI003FD5E688
MSQFVARIHTYGGADNICIEPIELLPPDTGELQIRNTAIGVNFVDIYHRKGVYPLPLLPGTLGVEGAGVIESIGPGVEGFYVGQRIAYTGVVGSYATQRNLPANRAVLLPEAVGNEYAAVTMLKGMTAHMLFTHVRPLRKGDTVLIHAAAGGLGLILVQWAKSLGARVIGTVGSREKAELAESFGLDHSILYREEDFVAATLSLTAGKGVDFAIDGIGGDTLTRTLATIRPYGMAASIGQVSGEVGSINLDSLGPARSIALSRPSVFRFMTDLSLYQEGAEATLKQLQAGMLVHIGGKLPLEKAALAHRQLEDGKTTGVLLLQP